MKLTEIVLAGWTVSTHFGGGCGLQTSKGDETLASLIIASLYWGFDVSPLYKNGEIIYERLAKLIIGDVVVEKNEIKVTLSI